MPSFYAPQPSYSYSLNAPGFYTGYPSYNMYSQPMYYDYGYYSGYQNYSYNYYPTYSYPTYNTYNPYYDPYDAYFPSTQLSYGYPTGDAVPWLGGEMCYYPDYGRSPCAFDPHQPIYDVWTGTYY
jgi:hypothetical protein